MIRRDGRRIVVSGPVTLANVGKLLEEGRQHLAEGAGTIDLGEVTELDSGLLALSLAWLREAASATTDAMRQLDENVAPRLTLETLVLKWQEAS